MQLVLKLVVGVHKNEIFERYLSSNVAYVALFLIININLGMKNSWKCILLFLLCTNCIEDRNIFNTKEVVFDNFKHELSLNAKAINFDTIVMAPINIFFIDNFLLFKHHEGPFFFSLYNLQSNKFVGRFIQRGRGPNEFNNLSYMDEYTLQDNERWLYMSDNNLKHIIKFNLSYYLQSGHTQVELLHQYDDKQIGRTHIINDSTFLAYMFAQNKYGLRVFYRRYSTSGMQEEMNFTTNNIKNFDEFDKLWGAEQLHQDKSMMVRAMTRMNLIHIINLSNPKSNITLTPKGQRHISLEELVQQPPTHTTVYYSCVKTTQNYIFALFHNQLLGEWQRKPQKVEIHVFDWNGCPLFKLHINEYLDSFCIDPTEKIMYAFDYDENVYQYDLSEIL